MLEFFPFIGRLPALATIVTLAMLVMTGEIGRRAIGLSLVVFVLAAYCQFLSGSPLVAAAGLGVQALLAVTLIVRWRLGA